MSEQEKELDFNKLYELLDAAYRCPNCHARVDFDLHDFCPQCGEELPDLENDSVIDMFDNSYEPRSHARAALRVLVFNYVILN